MDTAKMLVLAALALLCAAAPAAAELTAEQKKEIEDVKKNFKYASVTTPQGLVFRVPEDMPIETRAGIQAPIPFDEYMYGKFKQIDSRLKNIETKLDAIADALKYQAPSADEKSAKNSSVKVI